MLSLIIWFSVVAEKLKQEGKQEMLQQETMEELEDDEGNVYDKKVSSLGVF